MTISNVEIQMSDGVTLVGDVSLPDSSGRFPTILVMTPYGPTSYITSYVDRGYAHANFDIRGSGRSGGAICVFCEREQRDVSEVVQWIAGQSWSDGNVGMTGGSYLGITALMGAAQQPEALKAIVPIAAYSDAYRDIAWHNGLFSADFVAQWTALQPALGSTGPAAHPRVADRAANPFIPFTVARSEPLDGPFWRERAIYNKLDRITAPTLLISGWFDGFSRGNVWNFQGIAAQHKRLIMGPGTHKNWHGRFNMFDPLTPYAQAGPPPGNPSDLTLAWFDRFLRGIQNGIEAGPPVQYYDLGSFQWKSASTWPPSGTTVRRIYLSGARSGSAISVNDGSLAEAPPIGPATTPDSYRYDPTVGVAETFSKWGTLAVTPHLRLDQRPDEARALTYTTAALQQPLTLAGPIELHMWAQTDASDTAWVVKLTDVSPDGGSMLVTSGYMRASHRAWRDWRPAEPWILNDALAPVVSAPLEYRIDIWHTAYQVQPGHRLRITIASSDVPNHEPVLEPASNSVFHDADHPSELLLTVGP